MPLTRVLGVNVFCTETPLLLLLLLSFLFDAFVANLVVVVVEVGVL